ncbi:MAG: uroporphyrinogen-III C-methyltransferase [Thermoleophilaceae bacterium]|nr:uroporphyrinogen-III C-methyltransferase [Thermoleophilaceae bacterium]
MSEAGKVFLVGAGPGDPGLMTARGLELIASADAVLYDRLIPTTALDGAREDAILEYAGKGPSGDSIKQGGIEARMIELAQEGKSVVRLKGGDPFVFGRGGEEAAALAALGIAFEVVPGVTAGVAAAAYAGIPVTHRDHAAAVAFITGHEDPSKPETAIDWPALAAFPGTLVFYMGVKNLPRISEQLIEAGRSADQPAAVIQQGTTTDQRTVTGRLVDLPELAVEAAIKPPALTVIGDVVGERERIAWFEQRPLFGRQIAVTRARAQASRFAAQLAGLGAKVVQAPAIATRERSDDDVEAALAEVESFEIIAFTSANGVEAFFAALVRAGKDARALFGASVAVVGGATKDALAAHGIVADHVPQRQTAEGLLDALSGVEVSGRRILLPLASDPRPVLGDGLRARGADVLQIAVYDTVVEGLSAAQISDVADSEFVTFASASAVHSLMQALGGPEPLHGCALVSIGPTTSEALREYGLEPTAEAERSDIDGLLEALLGLA